MKRINSLSDFAKIVEGENVIIEFYTDWSETCKLAENDFPSVTKQNPQFQFYKINVEHFEPLIKQYGIKTIPTLLRFSHSKEVDRISGTLTPLTIERFIK